MKFEWLPREERKTILLLGDDMRIPSGIGTMSKEFIEGTCHRYNWVQLGAAITHPDAGKVINISSVVGEKTGVKDASVIVHPWNGYGDQVILRNLIKNYSPSAILHFTDPRYWIWLYQMEHEIRTKIPLMFYTIWDDLPYPYYNENFYRSCDWLGCISKQTYNIVKNVRARKEKTEPWQVSYVPHGINPNKYYKITKDMDIYSDLVDFKESLFGDKKYKFVLFYNSRNIRRKMTSDIILAFDKFMKTIPEKDRDDVVLLLHTQRSDEAGTDLNAVISDVTPGINVVFTDARYEQEDMNFLYNCADVTINISSNEGFGLSVAESLMCEVPVIVNVTGGLQDQCGFVDENGTLLHEDVHFTKDWGSNHDGKYKDHGDWVIPVWPKTRSLVGSPLTPYIFDDRCDWEDVASAIKKWYKMSKKERLRRGKVGREFCLNDGGLNSENMCNLFIEHMERAMERFTPRERFFMEVV